MNMIIILVMICIQKWMYVVIKIKVSSLLTC